MPSTRNSNNTAINMDLEEGLAATSSPPPPSSNRNSARSAAAFSPGNGPSLLAGSHHLRTTDRQPDGAEVEVAAAATAPSATFPATSNDRGGPGPELVDGAVGLPLPIGMIEEGFAKGSSASAAKNLRSEKIQRFNSPPFMGQAASNAAAASIFGGQTPSSGLEVIDDNHGLPVPIGMHGWGDQSEGKKRAAVELIEDDSGPAPPGDTLAASIEELNSKTNKDLKPPIPFNPSAIEDADADAKKRARMPSDMDSVVFPPDEDYEEPLTTTSRGDRRRHQRLPSHHPHNRSSASVIDDSYSGPVDTDLHDEEEERNYSGQAGSGDHLFDDEEEGGHANENDATVRSTLEQDPSVPIIPEAFLVEEQSNDGNNFDDGMIIHGHATRLLPWWKQRRTKLLLAVLVLLALSLGIPLSLKPPATTTTNVIFTTSEPSQSNAPSPQPSDYPTRKPSVEPSVTNLPSNLPSDLPSEYPTNNPSDMPSTSASPSHHPTDVPSASLVPTKVPSVAPSDIPSNSPSACVNQILTNVQMIDLPINDSFNPLAAVDGKNMIVAVQQGWDGLMFIIFYTLANGEWQSYPPFQQDNLGNYYNVALSGNTAFVGFEYANDGNGAVFVYENDQYGNWKLIEDPFIHDDKTTFSLFGRHVDIDGDLACVEDDIGGTYLYHRENAKWVQFGRINGRYCSISGDTIATKYIDGSLYLQLYRYNQESNRVTKIQNPILMDYLGPYSLDLSNDYLIYWDNGEEDAVMYHWEGTNQAYTLLQQLNISSPKYIALALDDDILVVGGSNKTHIFTDHDGKWEETITLNQSYNHYALSGRSLIATSWGYGGVHYYKIEDCTQQMPTQTPSLSIAPTDLPSSSPSISPSPTLLPSSSSSPIETCYWIQVAITYDHNPTSTWWQLVRGNQNIKWHRGSVGDTSYVESFCLLEGEYRFGIWDNGYDGICCKYGAGNFNVTSNGMLIVDGGEFGFEKTATFSIPFIMHPSISPSSSSSPSISPSLSSVPTSSSPPTLLQCIEVVITYDSRPFDTFWRLYRVVGDGGDKKFIFFHKGSSGDTSHVEPLCLRDGDYIFEINDDGLDGRFYGNYEVTSNGMLIVEGGEFGFVEETVFSIPFTSHPPSTIPSTLPTMAPSSSFSPSMSLPPTAAPSSSTSPTMIPSSSPTLDPTSSSPPTLLQCIEVAITYDRKPYETSWELYRVVGDDWFSNEFIKRHKGSSGDTSYIESLCLQEGEYIFTIIDIWYDGICCNNGKGNYNVTSNGILIVEGGDFKSKEATAFSIPFASPPSTIASTLQTKKPSSSSSPRTSPSPTLPPSSSSAPTMCTGMEYTSDINSAEHSYTAKIENDSNDSYFIQYIPSLDQTYVIGTFVGFEGDGSIAKFEGGDYCEAIQDDRSGTVEFVNDCNAAQVTYNVTEPTTCVYHMVISGLCCGVSSSSTSEPSSSSYPSTSPPSSLSPPTLMQTSHPTETCFWIQVAITYDYRPDETGWYLQRIVEPGDDDIGDVILSYLEGFGYVYYEEIKRHDGSEGDTSHVESLCLQKGEYKFRIYDSGDNGICCWNFGEGNYNVTSNGQLIVEGGQFESYEETIFSVPFLLSSPSVSSSSSLSTSSPSVPTFASPSTTPSSSPTKALSFPSSPNIIPTSSSSSSSSPSISPSPTLAPSSSSSQTETCSWIQVAITYNDHPYYTSWYLYRVVGDGEYEWIKYHFGSFGDTFHVETFCLQEGKYIFTIHDSGSGGICCDNGEGNYNVTSDGILIVEGGDWDGESERTSFSIPFVPSS